MFMCEAQVLLQAKDLFNQKNFLNENPEIFALPSSNKGFTNFIFGQE